MKFATFTELFSAATAEKPFPYQREFAESPDLMELINAPTGSGKTAAAILGWLWRLHFDRGTPRRLIYCLPMRVLVEQTRDEAKKWLDKLGLDVGVHVLMGGEEKEDWDLDPERPAILIGTQDMLLSRALNRGYGMGRFRWPMHYALVNNDCLWVLDEIQLMGVGLATSAQLQAFREMFPTFGAAKTVWMSATLRREWLATVDFRDRVPQLPVLNLDERDYSAAGLHERWTAKKAIENSKLSSNDTAALAEFIKGKHQANSLTLVVVNKVDRSRKLFAAVKELYESVKSAGRNKTPKQPVGPTDPVPDLKLIHSRFRPMEREGWMQWLKGDLPPEGRIIISTQVVEAGVDMSARTLFTELAPWPSLVQRFGRCNRRGEFTKDQPAQIYWIDVPAKDDKEAAPYTKAELDAARKQLVNLKDAGLESLHEFSEALSDKEKNQLFRYDPPHVIRRKDFVDLFDTTPDLAGNDIDVSRFIREGDELDVQVFWRTEDPPRGELEAKVARRLAPVREELCPVPVGAFREFVDKEKKRAFRWDALDGTWVKAGGDAVYPGQVFWIPRDQGGYSKDLGWDPKAPWANGLELYNPPEEPLSKTAEPEYNADLLSVSRWRSIAEHTEDVLKEIETITGEMADGIPATVLHVAGRWHDWGKAHEVFQDAVKDDSAGDAQRPGDRAGKRDIAKAAPKELWRRYARKHFRHELASALGVLTLLRGGKAPPDWASLSPQLQNVALYLIAAHHGKVRLSIRSMPDETRPKDADALFARGVWDGDDLPDMDLGGEVKAPAVTLDLSPMQLGRGADGAPSWAERMLGLRNHAEFGHGSNLGGTPGVFDGRGSGREGVCHALRRLRACHPELACLEPCPSSAPSSWRAWKRCCGRPTCAPARRPTRKRGGKMAERSIVPVDHIENSILLIRGNKVLLSIDLALLYNVVPKTLMQAVNRNINRFPADFMFQLSRQEYDSLRSQFVTLKRRRGQHSKYPPYAFTELGVAMLSSVLRSERAVKVNIEIMRAFVRLRRLLNTHEEIARKLEVLELKYDAQFKVVFEVIRELMEPPLGKPKGRFGF